jgi:ATP-binding cassette, subfamily B, heavy metal transporter
MSPHTSPHTDDHDRIESASGGLGAAMAHILKLLARPELRRWRPVMLLALLLTIAAKLIAVAAPVVLGSAINKLGAGGSDALLQASLMALAGFAGLRFASSGLPQLRDALFSPVSQDAQRLAAVDAFGHAQSLSLNFHQTRRAGALNRIIERGASSIDYLIRFLAFNIGPTFIELFLAAIVLGVAYDWWLSVVAIGTVVGYVLFTVLLTEFRVKQRRALNKADTEWRAVSVDTMTNFETVKAFAAEKRETARYDEAIKDFSRHYVRTTTSLAGLNAGQELIMNIGLFAMLAVAAWQVSLDGMQVGDVTAVMLLLFNLYRPLNILGWAWREIKQGAVDLEKLRGLMGMRPEVADRQGATELQKAEGRVVFEHVSFAHAGRDLGINDVSFEVARGRQVALVGPSGAGKSTLLKLLFRFYDAASGRVLIDGHDVRDLTQESLRTHLGLVPQDVVLFNDTIRQNIAYGRPDADDEALRDAARRAQLLDFIEGLPDGWDTRVGERGLKLSGGEKQRVGIARVILRDPAILVLDEATSALDTATEQAVQAALEEASRGRTVLTVAHRLSTIRKADEILVLEQGRVVERGSFIRLLDRKGLFAEMWHRQVETEAAAPATAAQETAS